MLHTICTFFHTPGKKGWNSQYECQGPGTTQCPVHDVAGFPLQHLKRELNSQEALHTHDGDEEDAGIHAGMDDIHRGLAGGLAEHPGLSQ